jgi:rRNA maturation endonuclease Nob1
MNEFIDFNSFKCTRCKTVFKITKTNSGFCSYCDKKKNKYMALAEASYTP